MFPYVACFPYLAVWTATYVPVRILRIRFEIYVAPVRLVAIGQKVANSATL